MPTFPRKRVHLPSHLEVSTVANASLDEVGLIPQYAVVVYPGVKGQEVYVDGTRVLDKGQIVAWGHIAIMHCVGWNGEHGIVGDLRYMLEPHLFDTVQRDEIPEELLGDESALDAWRSERGEYPVAAFAYNDPDGNRAFEGDRDFYPAAARLTELVDELISARDAPKLAPFQYARAQMYGYIANMGHFLSGI